MERARIELAAGQGISLPVDTIETPQRSSFTTQRDLDKLGDASITRAQVRNTA